MKVNLEGCYGDKNISSHRLETNATNAENIKQYLHMCVGLGVPITVVGQYFN